MLMTVENRPAPCSVLVFTRYKQDLLVSASSQSETVRFPSMYNTSMTAKKGLTRLISKLWESLKRMVRRGFNKPECDSYNILPIGWSNTNFKSFFKFEFLWLGNVLYLNNSFIVYKIYYTYRVHDTQKIKWRGKWEKINLNRDWKGSNN